MRITKGSFVAAGCFLFGIAQSLLGSLLMGPSTPTVDPNKTDLASKFMAWQGRHMLFLSLLSLFFVVWMLWEKKARPFKEVLFCIFVLGLIIGSLIAHLVVHDSTKSLFAVRACTCEVGLPAVIGCEVNLSS